MVVGAQDRRRGPHPDRAAAGQVVPHEARELPLRQEHPRPELGAARVPPAATSRSSSASSRTGSRSRRRSRSRSSATGSRSTTCRSTTGSASASRRSAPHHAYDFLIVILRVIVLFNPLKVFVPVADRSSSIGVAKFVYDVFIVGNLSETAVLCILGAIIIWSVGLLADQNSRLALNPEPFEKRDRDASRVKVLLKLAVTVVDPRADALDRRSRRAIVDAIRAARRVARG